MLSLLLPGYVEPNEGEPSLTGNNLLGLLLPGFVEPAQDPNEGGGGGPPGGGEPQTLTLDPTSGDAQTLTAVPGFASYNLYPSSSTYPGASSYPGGSNDLLLVVTSGDSQTLSPA